MKKALTGFFLFFFFSSFSQTDLSGVINVYASVSVIDTCTASLTVSASNGFVPNEKLIIYQAQGAEINESNNASFGDIIDLGSTGLFEIGTIKTVAGNVIQLENRLLNKFDLDGSVQIISYPEYENARIIDTVRAIPWDGQIGGIVAFRVTNELFFEAPIDVSGMGFRGGEVQTIANSCIGGLNNASAYFYDQTNWRGAKKGEGIAKYISDKEFGRGAQANGGGGGNDHNSGGGGGGNYTAGGIGGEREEDFFTGACKGANPGEAGKEITVSDNRVFFGGGGGSGHDNNMVGTAGGNGGGLVFLDVKDVEVITGGKILVNGDKVEITRAGDGAGGGGAGGSVVIRIENLRTDLDIEAFGGEGGTVNNGNVDRSFGPGGGGSGGVVKEIVMNRFNNSQTFNFLDGGEPGLTTNTTRSSNNTTNGAEIGTSGRKSTFLGFPESDVLSGPPTFDPEPAQTIIICAGNDGEIIAEAVGNGITYQWQIFNGVDFEDLPDGAGFSGTNSGTLQITNADLAFDGSQFRLVAMNICGESSISRTTTLTVQIPTIVDFNYVINGTEVQFVDASLGASGLLWNFGNNITTTDQNPTYDFMMPGTYSVTLTATGPCGIEMKTETIVISDTSNPTAGFSSDMTDGCIPATFQLNNLSSSNSIDFQWIFPGGDPTTSSDESPTVTYNSIGNYDVILVAINPNGRDTLVRSGYFTVRSGPTANFDFTVNGQTVTFNDLSIDANSYTWDFGDSQISASDNPQHTYQSDGTFTVTLTVENDCGIDFITRDVTIGSAPVAGFDSDKRGGCAPMSVTYTDNSTGDGLQRTWSFPGGTPATSNESPVQVIYDSPGFYTVRLVVENSIATDSLVQVDYIEALPRPFAGFDFDISGTSVMFNNTSTGSGNFMWDFGDGGSSSERNPTYTFPGPGSYFVTLNAVNSFCSGSITRTVNITSTNTEDIFESGLVKIYPNPVSNVLKIESVSNITNEPIRLELTDITGRIVFLKNEISELESVNVSFLTGGIYFVRLISERGKFVTKFVKVAR